MQRLTKTIILAIAAATVLAVPVAEARNQVAKKIVRPAQTRGLKAF